jgi:hypothetical protein
MDITFKILRQIALLGIECSMQIAEIESIITGKFRPITNIVRSVTGGCSRLTENSE